VISTVGTGVSVGVAVAVGVAVGVGVSVGVGVGVEVGVLVGVAVLVGVRLGLSGTDSVSTNENWAPAAGWERMIPMEYKPSSNAAISKAPKAQPQARRRLDFGFGAACNSAAGTTGAVSTGRGSFCQPTAELCLNCALTHCMPSRAVWFWGS